MAGKRILVIDDSLTIQKVIKLALSNDGHEIKALSDANDALGQISLFRPDIVLIDVSLPGKSAFELKAEVEGSPDLANVRFVLMSSAFEQVDESKVESSRFAGRLVKPFDPAHLRQVLEDATKGGQTMAFEPPGKAQTDDLWGQPGSISHSSPSPEIEDIRQLTESTIKLSGLDDLNWSVNETGKIAGPPPASSESIVELEEFEPTLPPPPGMFRDDSSFEQKSESSAGIEVHEDPRVVPLSTSEMEQLLKKQLHETVRSMAREMLPGIAEKVIKSEIHRLLSEGPPSEGRTDTSSA